MSAASILSRSTAAAKYIPHRTRILFVAEAPPNSPDRYFYFEDVKRDDWLWIALMKALYSSELGVTKAERQRKPYWLGRFQQDEFRLIDAVKESLAGNHKARVAAIRAAAPTLMSEIKEIAPEYIVLIKAAVHEALFSPLKANGFPAINERVLPFPAAGQQRRFQDEFRELIASGTLPLHHGGTREHIV